jgi:hypothetical protein
MVAPNPHATGREVVELGERIYRERLRELLEPAKTGKYVVIDVDTGEYEVDSNHRAASDRACAKRPHPRLYGKRIGFATLGRIGAQGRTATR